MSNKKPLYQPWNEEEFMSDTSVRVMTSVQRWIYRTLLQASFFHTTRPFLPSDDKVLWVLAGCESYDQWLQNKKSVLKMFTPVKGNRKLIENKRVTGDWGRLEKARERMSELGRKSAAVQRTFNARSTHAEQPLNKGIGIVKEKDIEKEKSEPEDSDMSFKNNITDKCRSILSTRIFPGDQGWDEMNSLKRVHGAARVEEAFTEWAESVEGEMITYPLTAFLRIADGLFAGQSTNSKLAKPLILELSYLSDGRVTFSPKQSIEIARLLETCSEADIKAAFKEFLDNLPETSVQYAGKDFSEKAEQIIYTQRKRKQQTAQINKQLEDIMVSERKKVEENLAKLPEEFDPSVKIEL